MVNVFELVFMTEKSFLLRRKTIHFLIIKVFFGFDSKLNITFCIRIESEF